MTPLIFEGRSDDTFGEYGRTNDDYDNCASGKPIRFLVTAGGESLIVFGQYCPKPATGWMIGVARADEDDAKPIPAWPMRFEHGERPYSPRLVLDAPEDATVKWISSHGSVG